VFLFHNYLPYTYIRHDPCQLCPGKHLKSQKIFTPPKPPHKRLSRDETARQWVYKNVLFSGAYDLKGYTLKRDKISDLVSRLNQGDFRVLAKLLTQLDQWSFNAADIKGLFNDAGPFSLRLGITGPPGAGKSTIINELIRYFRSKDFTVGVLAVDPSSPFTRGAILGDRIRYSEFFNDPKVYIRSLGSRGSLGGLSASTYLMLRAYDLMKFDIVLVETVGVGQTELDIMNVADILSVVLVPESGDSIQAMKAGLLEITNLFLVNKADRPGSETFSNELKATLDIASSKANESKIFKTVATESKGITEFCDYILDQKKTIDLTKKRNDPSLLQNEALSILKHIREQELIKKVEQIKSPSELIDLF
jgi:LAO/AO transport system kinase